MKKNQRYSDPATPISTTDLCCFITAAVAMKTPLECSLSPLVGRSPPFLSVPMVVVDKTRVLTVMGSVVGCNLLLCRSPPFLSVPMVVVDKTRVLTVMGSVVGCNWKPVSLTCKTVDEFAFALLNCICIFVTSLFITF